MHLSICRVRSRTRCMMVSFIQKRRHILTTGPLVNFSKKKKKNHLTWKSAAREAQEKHVDALHASLCKQKSHSQAPRFAPAPAVAAATGYLEAGAGHCGAGAPLHLSGRLQLPTLLTVSGSQLARGVGRGNYMRINGINAREAYGFRCIKFLLLSLISFLSSFPSSAFTQKGLQTQALVRTDSTTPPCPRIIARTPPSIPGTTASSYHATQTAKV